LNLDERSIHPLARCPREGRSHWSRLSFLVDPLLTGMSHRKEE
jgi:hypothetical protein